MRLDQIKKSGKGDNILELKSWLSRTKTICFRTAFFIQYYTKKLFAQIKKRAPLLKKLHLDSFPAIHIKKMDWMDFSLKFSGELLVLVLALGVSGLNLFYFSYQNGPVKDQSLAGIFLSRHAGLNPKVYAKNNAIVTKVSSNLFFPQAQADNFSGLDSQAAALGEETGLNEIAMSDENSLLAPNPDSIQSQLVNVVKKIYPAQSGDTLKSIGLEYGVSVNSIKWSNPTLAGNEIKPGWNLIIPPVDGVAVTADANTTLPDLAVKYNPLRYSSDKNTRDAKAAQLLETIIAYNGLASAEDVNDGDFLIIPGGELANPPAPVPPPSPKPAPAAKNNGASDIITSVGSGYDGVNHVFPKGYCTYYVANRMKITFGGNAKNWLANAKASGYVTGKEAAPHSAVVTTDSKRWGHVAYVEEVTDTGILVSEMNYEHFNKVNQRWIPLKSPVIRGYIYP